MNSNPWNIEKLREFIGCEESNVLDFKSSKAFNRSTNDQEEFIDGLTTHVSAFLNSDGGMLLIGLEELDRKGQPDVATELSTGVPRKQINASKLEQKLCDRIHPSVAGYVNVFPVVVGKDSEGDLLAFVVKVKAGVTAYQAKNKLYYARRSYSSEPMEDKDIRLRMLSGDKPRATLLCQTKPGIEPKYGDEFARANIFLNINNVGYQTIREYSFKYEIVQNDYTKGMVRCDVLPPSSSQSSKNWRMSYVRHDSESPDQEPLFPGAIKQLLQIHLVVPKEVDRNQFSIYLEAELFIDNGQPVIERFEIDEDCWRAINIAGWVMPAATKVNVL